MTKNNTNSIVNNLMIKEPSEEIFRKLEDPNYKRGLCMLAPWATKSEKMKYQVCRDIVKFKKRKNIPNEEIIKRLGITSAKLETILDHDYEELTLEELMDYLEKLALSEQVELTTYYHNSLIEQQYQMVTQ